MKVAKTATAGKPTTAKAKCRKPVPPSPDLTKRLKEAFSKADSNGDGKLCLDEYVGAKLGDARGFGKADASRDRHVDLVEWLQANLPGKQPPGKKL